MPRHASLAACAALLGLAALAPAGLACNHDGVRNGSEACDGTDLGAFGCENLCFDGGRLACRADCTFETAGCTRCGNGRREPGEACDGADLGGWTCPEGGVAACAPDCFAIDERGCFRCGNGRREGTEECDQGDLGGAACDAPGETGGALACTAGCRLDRTGCWRCGNGRVDPGEECDDGAANGAPDDGCTLACRTACGDGVLQAGEECDDGNRADGDGCSARCAFEAPYGGGGGEPWDLCAVEWGVAGLAGGVAACRDGAPCDRDPAAGRCGFTVSYCLNTALVTSGGTTPCRPTDVARVALAPETTLDAAARAAFFAALAATLGADGGAVAGEDPALVVTPALAARHVCGEIPVGVAAGASVVLAVEATDAAGAADRDRLGFTCTP
ncbi:MAG TPA: DUF4215 domain-containing protein [Candidatus Binatia bacterium]|nr:DUF4215 domain-containing protein [Candidatus Binatia bacterium]